MKPVGYEAGVEGYDDTALLAGEQLCMNIQTRAAELFDCIQGDLRAVHVEGDRTYTYVSYVFGHRGTEDRRMELARLMVGVLDRMKALGAVRLIWRKKPHFAYDESESRPVRTTHLRMRCAALTSQGTPVVIDDAVKLEGQPIRGDYLRDLGDGVALNAAVHPRDPDTVDDEPVQTELSAASVEEMDVVVATDDAVLHCAAVCYAVTKALNDRVNEHTVPWELVKASTIAGVRTILAERGVTAAQLHGRWMDYKAAEGWVYGETKDEKAKTHPCMVPYAQLPESQRIKDVIFGAIVRSYFGIKD